MSKCVEMHCQMMIKDCDNLKRNLFCCYHEGYGTGMFPNLFWCEKCKRSFFEVFGIVVL